MSEGFIYSSGDKRARGKRRGWAAALLGVFGAVMVSSAWAADGFRVTGFSLNAEAPRGEVCLTVNRPLPLADREALAQALRLEKDGDHLPVAPRDLSLTPTDLCIQQLEHGATYRLTVKALRDQDGEGLAASFQKTFTMPDRNPSLALVLPGEKDGLPRYAAAPDLTDKISLRGLNVKVARLRLFRIEAGDAFGAWQQAAQASLVPSESQFFAAQNGKEVWRGDIVFGAKANVEQTAPVPLPDRLPQGLYFLAATPQQGGNAAFVAGQWFLISDLKVQATRQAEGLRVTASRPETTFQLLGRDGQNLAEDKGGAAVLTIPKDAEPFLLFATDAAGDMAFVDLSRVPKTENLSLFATLTPDRALYQGGATAVIALAAGDAQGHIAAVPEKTSLKLLRPDQSVAGEQFVLAGKSGPMFVSLPLPSVREAGVWTLLWQQTNGRLLARASLKLAPEALWPKIEVAADRAFVDSDGNVTLNVKASDSLTGKPLAWRGGSVSWQYADPVFPAWKNYRFGRLPEGTEDKKAASFITDAKGVAVVKINLPLDDAAARSVLLTVKPERVAEPVTLNLPTRAASGWIGIKPRAPVFAENSEAVFDVAALDSEGKNRAERTEDLSFQIYEEGRSFRWYPDEGRWDYQPSPQHRRLGGGRMALDDRGSGVVRWPVTAGHYQLDIMNDRGEVLAQTPFEAVWNTEAGQEIETQPVVAPPLPDIAFSVPSSVTSGGAVVVPVVVTKKLGVMPTFLAAEVRFDDSSGVVVPPVSVDKAGRATLRFDLPASSGPLRMTLQAWNDKTLFAPKTMTIPARPALGVIVDPLPETLAVGDHVPFRFHLENNRTGEVALTYSVVFGGALPVVETLTLKHGAARDVVLPWGVQPVEAVQLDVTGPDGFHEKRVIPANVAEAGRVAWETTTQQLKPQQTLSLRHDRGVVVISAIPLFGVPQALQTLIRTEPFSTEELAQALVSLRAWRDVIVALGLSGEAGLQQKQDSWRRDLLRRQTNDGGFAAYPDENVSDLVSTAAAVEALAGDTAQGQATAWLRHRLENTWFDEKERASRAAGLAALAATKQGDVSALRYFADTSRDSALSVAVQAQLARALAQSHDDEGARFWLEKVKAASTKNWDVLRERAENPLDSFPDVLRAAEALSAANGKKESLETSLERLRAVAALRDRVGVWHLVVNGHDEAPSGFFFAPVPREKRTPTTVHNPSGQKLFVSVLDKASVSVPRRSVTAQRQLYRLDGERVAAGEALQVGQTYVLAVRGDGFEDQDDRIVTVPVGGGLQPVDLAADPRNLTTLWPWLSGARAEASHLAPSPTTVRFSFQPSAAWRFAYPVKAVFAGRFTLPPLTVRDPAGSTVLPEQTPLVVDVR